ncbi:MAG: hypothetical protein J7621_07635 [Niastella sp.]|nr:hypothetical protein [Niastella sp.]
MKKQHTKKGWMALQALVLAGIAVFAFVGLLSFKAVTRYADFWEQIGTNKQSGTWSIKESFLNARFYYRGKNFRNILTGDRAAVAKDLLTYTKEYVNTEEFAKEYETHRQRNKPAEPEKGKTPEAVRQKFIDDTKKGIESTEKFIKSTNDAEMKKAMNESLTVLKSTLKDYEDPNSEVIKLMIEGEKQQYEYKLKSYQNDLKAWEETYPASIKEMIKTRLQQVLSATSNVDYNAQLVARDGLKRFAKPDYERKSAEWKMAFRAGKETTEAVRAFAKQWLQELQ